MHIPKDFQMALTSYHKKRNFEHTPEPKGKIKSSQKPIYVIQKHAASHLHYDLRLEIDGVLRSWACPKGPSLNPHDKRLAVLVEDHPIEYADFEGVIPKGQYGGGEVIVWDKGTWEPEGDPNEDLKKGTMVFTLYGKKLKGKWALVRFKTKKDFLLIKKNDAYADPKADITHKSPKSVISGRKIEDLKNDEE